MLSIARLNPLQGGTILHIFGYDESVLTVNAKVVGESNKEALVALTTDPTTVVFSGDQGALNVYVSSVRAGRDDSYWQTLDITQDCTAPVYTVALELYPE